MRSWRSRMRDTRPQDQPAAIACHAELHAASGYALETRRARTARDASKAASWSDHGLAGVAMSPTRRSRRIAARTTSTRSLPVTTMLRPTVRAGPMPLSRPSSSLLVPGPLSRPHIRAIGCRRHSAATATRCRRSRPSSTRQGSAIVDEPEDQQRTDRGQREQAHRRDEEAADQAHESQCHSGRDADVMRKVDEVVTAAMDRLERRRTVWPTIHTTRGTRLA